VLPPLRPCAQAPGETVAGVGVAFSLNALSFAGVMVLVARWSKDRFWLGPSTHVPGMRAHALLRNSPNRHATKHARTSGHPVIASAEPGERWLYCYPDDEFAEY